MKTKKNKYNLDDYEKEILNAYEKGKVKVTNSNLDHQAIAKNTLKKNKKINIRISESDLNALRQRAAREGIPYQTLIGSILHKYLNGYLEEVK